MKRVSELDVYKLAEELSDLVWTDFDSWDKKAQNTIGFQIIRASDSIAANIAEGYVWTVYACRQEKILPLFKRLF
jgi:four helix bundle protein